MLLYHMEGTDKCILTLHQTLHIFSLFSPSSRQVGSHSFLAHCAIHSFVVALTLICILPVSPQPS